MMATSNKKMKLANLVMILLVSWSVCVISSALQVGFYRDSCAEAEMIVNEVVTKAFISNPRIAAALVRMQFHDCFVYGCDASILIDSTPGNTAEKDSPANNPSLTGYEVIDEAKQKIERVCKGTVSCADIVAFVARDSARLAGGISWDVRAGRRDGRVSKASDVASNLVPPTFNVNQLTQRFQQKGLSQEDMVTLSGAHSIGRSHCSSFTSRLYNFSSTQDTDPMLDEMYATSLKGRCPNSSGSGNNTVPMEPMTPVILDNLYYRGIIEKRGLFTSDMTLMDDDATKEMVTQNSQNGLLWANKFASAMVKMGEIGVLTGNQGEIRLNCRVVNS